MLAVKLRGLLLLTVAVSALAVVSAAPAAKRNVCLLTNAEVGKALGGKIVSRTGGGTPARGYSCTWTGPTLHGFFAVTRTAELDYFRQSRAKFDSERDKARLHGAIIIPVRRIGTEAYENQGPIDVLNVWQDGYALSILPQSAISPLDTAETLAKIALTRL
jgi:hypothetical protein